MFKKKIIWKIMVFYEIIFWDKFPQKEIKGATR